MSDRELFDGPVVKSPRLKWMEKNNIRTKFYPGVKEGDESPETGKDLHPWVAWQYDGKVYPPSDAYVGDTQDDALAAWARAQGVKMWFEEGLT